MTKFKFNWFWRWYTPDELVRFDFGNGGSPPEGFGVVLAWIAEI